MNSCGDRPDPGPAQYCVLESIVFSQGTACFLVTTCRIGRKSEICDPCVHVIVCPESHRVVSQDTYTNGSEENLCGKWVSLTNLKSIKFRQNRRVV